ncbi:YndM family protein [Salinicoccus roseus]|uniref:YndM family protein n=1 Tax=Salinicoccus roseus TaxID=45670 RepID=UPI00356155D0
MEAKQREHVKALLIKAVMTLAVLWIVLGAGYGMDFWPMILVTTVVLGVISYFAGDLGILPAAGNMVATISDLVLTFLVVWLLGLLMTDISGGTVPMAALISAVVIAVGEYLFHMYMLKSGPWHMKEQTLKSDEHCILKVAISTPCD